MMLVKSGFLVFVVLVLAIVSKTASALDEFGRASTAWNDTTDIEDEPRKLGIVRGYYYYHKRSSSSKSSKGSKGSKSSKSSSRSKGGKGKGGKGKGYYSVPWHPSKLSRCQGDCDKDEDCESGLKCFQRGPYTAVPGCIGGEKDGSSTDYCVVAYNPPAPHPRPSRSPRPSPGPRPNPHPTPMIEYIGNDGHPSWAFPLKECQGDCDTDRDCASGLRCFQRNRFQAVPGCRGGENDSSRMDYCIKGPSAPHPRPSRRPTPRPTPRPTRNPTPRPAPRPTPRPPTRPNPHPTPMIEYVGNDRHPSSAYPLSVCEGDCDSDRDCASGLRCFQRDYFQAVPGCRGGEHDSSRTDYCIHGGPTAPHPRPSTKAPTPRPPTPRPPHGGGGSQPYVAIVGNDGKPSSAYPLGLCEGDCDDDDDCDYGLYCKQRDRYDPVPGCRGGESDSTRTDYCAPLPPGQQPLPGTFRLKLYWEEGYTWQEETRERKWCMTYDYDGWPDSDGICWYGDDSRSCSIDQVHISKCRNDSRQRFIFVALANSDEVLIKLGNGKNECFQRYRRSIYVRECDSNNSLQRWYALNGSFDGPKFEISQKDFSLQCVTTAHHPKAGEVVELHSCRASRSASSQSSYWNKY